MDWLMLVVFLVLALGVGLFVAGIYVLTGLGWALIAGGVSCVLFAFLIIRGARV